MDNTQQATSTLFVTEVPQNLQERDFVAVFQAQEGFKSARLRRDRNSNVVGFADFEDNESSALAMETLQGYKWSIGEKGIAIQFARNTNNTNSHKTQRINRQTIPKVREITQQSSQENGSKTLQHPSLSFMPDLSPSLQTLQIPSLQNYSPSNSALSQLPQDSSSTLFIEGLPSDATEREVAHIFRPFPGYQSLRILTKESKQNNSRTYTLCFVEFDNKYQATFAMNHLQGYRFDKDDNRGLSMSYAKTERKTPAKSLISLVDK